VTLKGTPPKPKKIQVSADPVCQDAYKDTSLFSETVVVQDVGGENRLRWVLVYLNRAPGTYPAPAEPVVLDQIGCRYVPHVVALTAGQGVKFHNSDPTLHNINVQADINKSFNFGQARKGAQDVRVFEHREIGIKARCDVHSWMASFICVLDHPFFAVTGEDGTFEIRDVPAGEHELVFWHEKYGEWKATVRAQDGQAATQDAVFEEK
jgi:plastocyanin